MFTTISPATLEVAIDRNNIGQVIETRPDMDVVIAEVMNSQQTKCARCGEAVRFSHRCIDL
jgi:hypothetical protein